METKKRGLYATELKYIAIIAMFIDHFAYIFVPCDSFAYGIMRFIGRFTIPVMCYFICEGYHYTKNLRKYYIRMIIFAVISHFAYSYGFYGTFFSFTQSSVIATLTLCLLSVNIVNTKKLSIAYKLPLIAIAAFFADKCDWGMTAIVFTLSFEFARGDKKKQCIAYSIAATWYCLPVIEYLIKGQFDIFAANWYKFGLYIPGIVIMLYNGKRGGGKISKWVFYVFYPLHLLILGYLYYNYI